MHKKGVEYKRAGGCQQGAVVRVLAGGIVRVLAGGCGEGAGKGGLTQEEVCELVPWTLPFGERLPHHTLLPPAA